MSGLPRLATDYTPEQRAQIVTLLAALPEQGLYDRLTIHRAQCVAARNQGRHDVADSELEKGMLTWEALDQRTKASR